MKYSNSASDEISISEDNTNNLNVPFYSTEALYNELHKSVCLMGYILPTMVWYQIWISSIYCNLNKYEISVHNCFLAWHMTISMLLLCTRVTL